MKELCTRLDSICNRNEREEDLLLNVKGLFYYACPHHGSELADQSTGFSKGPFFEEMTTLNKTAQRRNENFRKLREKYRWTTYGIQEGLPTTWEGFNGFIVQEASARHDVDGFYTDRAADHFSVCRPGSTTSSSFRLLLKFVDDLLERDKEEHSLKFDSSNVVDLKGRVKTLVEKLDGSQRLGIVGIGGIGKTSLAKAVYDIISGRFEYTGFVGDVKEFMTSKNDQRLLQEKIIGVMDRKGHKVDKSFSWQKLTGKKVLIVLDDVEFRSQVQVMTKLDDFSKESRIIVTSRDSGFLSAEGFDCYSVTPLETEESTKLLCLGAFKTEDAPSDNNRRVLEIVDKCGGFPLALTVVGKYLYGVNDEGVWNDALESLRNAKPLNGSDKDGLWSLLQVSYDSLASQEKEMFLDVATCFNGADLEMVKKAWKVCGWVSMPDAGLRNLLNKGLITIVEGLVGLVRLPYRHWGMPGKVIRMHEVLRDLGRSIIACPDPKNTARHSRLFFAESDIARPKPFQLWDDLQAELRQEAEAKIRQAKIRQEAEAMQAKIRQDVMQANAEVKVLRIDCKVDFNIEELRGLNELKILSIGENVILRGSCNLLPPKLAYIRCDGMWSPHREGLHSDITESVARNVAQRPALRCLEIRNSVSIGVLDTLGDFQALQSLEIYMQNWKALPESLSQLRALEYLVIEKCTSIRVIPDTLGDLQNLQHLVIEECTSIRVIPDTLGDLQNLQHLRLSCGCLKAIPTTLRNLRSLRHLEMTGCHDWTALLDIVGQLKILQKLVMKTCRLCEVADIMSQLDLLEYLNVRGSLQKPGQVDLPGSGLRDLRITSSQFLPSSFGCLSGDADMPHTCNCEHLVALPDSFGQLSLLRRLHVLHFKGLRALPGTLGKLQALEELIIDDCENLEALPDSLGQLSRLRRLHVLHCKGLRALPGTLGKLQALEELIINDCENLEALPDSLGQLSRLRRLHVLHCKGLRALPGTLGKLQALEELTIGDCENLEALPDSLGQLSRLLRLHVLHCKGLRALPGTLGNLQALEELSIEDCENLEALPDSLGQLLRLRRLHILRCDGLIALPGTLGSLQALEDLLIRDCKKLATLPDTLGDLPHLRHIDIHSCKSLKTLPGNLWQLPELSTLVIEFCENLESLPDAVDNQHRYPSVIITTCNKLILPRKLEELLGRRSLRVRSCMSKLNRKQGQEPSPPKEFRIRLRERP